MYALPGKPTPRAEAATAGQLALQQTHQQRLVDDALLSLAAAVPGDRPAAANGWDLPHDAAVVDFLARQIGLHPDPLRLRRALTDADVTGRDPHQRAGRRLPVSRSGESNCRRDGGGARAHRCWCGRQTRTRSRQPYGGAATTRCGPRTTAWMSSVDAVVADSLKSRGATFDPLLDPADPPALRDLLRIGPSQGSRHSTALVLGFTRGRRRCWQP